MTGRHVRALAAGLVVLSASACSPRGADLEIVADTSSCTIPKVVTVRWSIPEDEPIPALLRINGPGRPMKDWRQASVREGEAPTGPWAGDGLTVTLVSKSGRPLARRTLTQGPCDAG
ncbi:hypothetical protein H9645_00050 [Luteimonas sp. Sa2BVA3]|uniref:Uncharacterized protein n=1 Tax=Luteimonas colneyensis TaxID=2762230 RepID=A0ABR8UFE8_9GAMM|nr:hypothetical protein [Luteimonas colneyensis]MBD7986419.1 hypothetical protein [Luteimonas colneyensis]